jgi:hypothetical protein
MMKYLLVVLVWAVSCLGVSAADGVATFRAGLSAYQANGPDALLRTWYASDEVDKRMALKRRLEAITRDLGEVVDTQVFAPRDLGRHVQRLYGVIYFRKHPLWIRAEYYEIGGNSGFISLEFSLSADDILPLEIGVKGG